MIQDSRSSSPLSTVSGSPRLSAKENPSNLPAYPSSPKGNSKRPREEDDDGDNASPIPKKPAKEAEINADSAINRYPSKTETQNEHITQDDVLAVANENESTASQEAQATAVPAQAPANDNTDEFAEVEESTEKPISKAKAASKRTIATSGRRRACATCKRRKVSIISPVKPHTAEFWIGEMQAQLYRGRDWW